MDCGEDLTSPNDATILARLRRAYAAAAEAYAIGKGDRHITRHRLLEMREEIEWLEGRIAAGATPDDGGIILAVFK